MYRALVMFPKSAGSTDVEALIAAIASSFRSSVADAKVTRNAGPLMGPGAQAGEAGWILVADFSTMEEAMSALDADEFQAIKAEVEALTSSIFLLEVADA